MRMGMGTTCVYPLGLEEAFRTAAELGFDGVEVMVTRDEATQSAASLARLSDRYGIPVLSIHAPVLLLTHFVWGRDPRVKLERSAELAAAVGADTVVVHPPFRWQSDYADGFLGIVRETVAASGVRIAVENMFPWKVAGRSMAAYSPGWNPLPMDCDDVTLDFSHAALSGLDGLEFDPPWVRMPALDTRPGDWMEPLSDAVKGATGRAPELIGVPFGTDAGPLGAAGIPGVVFGPGDIAQAHTRDEWVELDQARQAADAYYRIARALG